MLDPSELPSPSVTILSRLLLLCLQCLLAIAPYHDNREEAADYGSEENNEDDGNANGPYAREEKGMKYVVIIDKGLEKKKRQFLVHSTSTKKTHRE